MLFPGKERTNNSTIFSVPLCVWSMYVLQCVSCLTDQTVTEKDVLKSQFCCLHITLSNIRQHHPTSRMGMCGIVLFGRIVILSR